MDIALLSHAFPPDFDAIGQYTERLGETLAGEGHRVVILTSVVERPAQREEKPRVVPCFRAGDAASLRCLPGVVRREAPEWLVAQFNPFGFGSRGFCPQLPRALAAIRREGRTKVAVMFHETMVPAWPWKFFLMRLWQLPTFRWLCRCANVVFVSTERWIPQVRRASATVPCVPLPVGANTPRSTLSHGEARRQLGIPGEATVLGVFGQNHPSRPLEWIVQAARAIGQERQPLLLCVGSSRKALAADCPEIPLLDCGVLPAEEVADRLRAMDALLSPFVDGVSTRRSSLISALQQGVPTATTLRPHSDGIFAGSHLAGLLLSRAENAAEFAVDAQRWMREEEFGSQNSRVALEAFHDLYFSWPVVAGTLLRALRDACGSEEPHGAA